MAFQVSPGVNISEIDASSSVPAVVTTIGGVVGRFSKGPVGEIVAVSSEEQLVSTFGRPNSANYKSWFTAANFLSYSGSLKVVRVVEDDVATASTTRARNALSGKVTATSATSGAVQNFTGAAAISSSLTGSSAQSFTQTADAAIASLNLHAGVATTTGGAASQFLRPRYADGTSTLITSGDAAGDDAIRTLTSADVSIHIRGTGVSSGGLLPAARYSIGGFTVADGQTISFLDSIGANTSSGPYYIHADASVGSKVTGTGNTPGSAHVAGTVTDMATAGFSWPMYTRLSDSNLADSGVYGGTGSSHIHYFTKYGGTATTTASANITLVAGHGLSVGDAVVYTASTADANLTANNVYYVASVSTNVVTISTTYNFATTTAGSAIALAGGGSGDALYKAFYMPGARNAAGTVLATGSNMHGQSAAPTDTSIKPWATGADTITVSVAQQSVFTMAGTAGANAVTNNLVTSTNSVDGVHSTSDYTVSANSPSITYTANLPLTNEIETVVIPARKSFALSPSVNTSIGETVEVTVGGTAATVGTAAGQFQLLSSGSRIEFTNTAPATNAAIAVTIKSKLANVFTLTGTNLLVKNSTDFLSSMGFANASANSHEWMARSTGTSGNNLHVYLIDESSYGGDTGFEKTHSTLAAHLTGAPAADDKSKDPSATQIANSEQITQGLSLIVTEVDVNGNTNVVEVIENMSKAGNGRSSDGANIYYVDVINNTSNYVYVLNHPSTTGMDWGQDISLSGTIKESFAKLKQDTSVTADGTEEWISRPFGNGQEGGVPTTTHYGAGFDLFADTETVDVGFLLLGEAADAGSTTAIAQGAINKVIDVASTRKDCIAVISPRQVDVEADKNAGNSTATETFLNGCRRSNYAFCDSNYKYQADKYNNKFWYIPFNGDTAGLMVRSELDRDAWFSPAGFNRGIYKGVVKTMVDMRKADRDSLYKLAINPVCAFSGQGTVLFGDKTFTMKPSAFSRINVRRLFIVLEKSIATAAKFTLFEFNDEFTRAQFTALIEPFLRDIKGRRGIFDFKVVCDSTNNTANVIDTNQFVGDIFIQPARSINFIQLNFVAVRTGVSFSEVTGAV